MSNTLKHKKVSVATANPDEAIVDSTDWNTEHAFAGGTNGDLLMRDTGQTDGARFITSPVVNVLLYGSALTHVTLQAALTSIGSTPTSLLLTPGTWTIGANLTIPATMTLVRARGAVLSISAGVTLTLTGEQDGPRSQWITGAGSLVFGGLGREVFPQWWGAQADGLTNDAAAVQAAIDALPASGGIVSLAGLYGIGAAGLGITAKTALVLRGLSPQSGLKTLAVSVRNIGGFTSNQVVVSACTGVHLRGIHFDGNSLASNAVAFDSNTDTVLEDCTFVNAGNTAVIACINNQRNVYRHNRILNARSGARGLWVGRIEAGRLDINPLIEGNIITNTGHSGLVLSVRGGIVRGNHISDTEGSGIAISSSDVELTSRLIIAHNYVKGNLFHGIQSDTATEAILNEFVSVIGNIVEENDNSGIYVLRARDWVIEGNICRNNNADGVSVGYGIQIQNAKRLSIVGNQCSDTRAGASRTQTTGISLLSQNVPLDVEDITILGNTTRNHLTTGIHVGNSVGATMANVTIVGNTCNENGTNGLFVPDAAAGDLVGIVILGNVAQGNGSMDLRVDPPDAVILGNRYTTSTLGHPTFTDADTTPSVRSRQLWIASNTAATTITTFDDGVDGQTMTVLCLNANTSFAHGSGIFTRTGASVTVAANSTISFVRRATSWYQVAP